MVKPGMTLTGAKRYTNFYIYKGKHVNIQKEGIYYDNKMMLKAYSILEFFIIDNTLFCITSNACIYIYNLVHKLLIRMVDTNLQRIYKVFLIQDTLYFIAEKGILFESHIKTLKFVRSNYGKYEDRFISLSNIASKHKYYADFKYFATNFVLYDQGILYLVDIYNRIYFCDGKVELLYHHYLGIIDIKIINGYIIIIDQQDDVTILKDNGIVTKIAVTNVEAIISSTLIACKDFIFDLSKCSVIYDKNDYDSLYYYNGSFLGSKKIIRNTRDTIITIPEKND